MVEILSNFKQQSFPVAAYINSCRWIDLLHQSKLFKTLHVIAIVSSFLIGDTAFAQQQNIDSLKKILPSLHDSARIDCLNELSRLYLELSIDTSLYYSSAAYNEAVMINYIPGIAVSFLNKGITEGVADNFPKAEELYRNAITWYRKTTNKKRLAETYYNLGFVQYAQSFFAQAIRNLDTAFEYYKKNNDQNGMFLSLFILGHVYVESGNYEKAFELDTKGLDLAIRNNNDQFRRWQLGHMASLFKSIGDYTTALEYYREAYSNGKPDEFDFAELFTLMRQYDSAKYYYSLADTSDERTLRFYLASTGEYYLSQELYDKALPNLLRSLNYNRQKNDRNQVMRLLMDVAKTHFALKHLASAQEYAREGLKLAIQTGAKQFVREGNQILYSIYDALHQADSAYYYYRHYIEIRDSILNDQVKAKLIAYGPKQKIELLNKEKQAQQTQLQKQSLLKNILIAGIVILLMLGTIIFRNVKLKRRNEKLKLQHELQLQKLKNERAKAALQQQAAELEMQALRAQMNPHFIFNSLNSINRFILKKQSSEATEYLTKFSRLIRLILQNSQAAFITLDCELEALQLYLELEAVRFENQFDYKIIIDEAVDSSVARVPPLIIQPYAENAIWHGLMHKEEKGLLEIEVTGSDDNMLLCKIKDNGIGRKKAAELKSKSVESYKSMGMRITAERIARLKQNKVGIDFITINDLVYAEGTPAGTEVILKIPQ